MTSLWSPTQLSALEKRHPTPEMAIIVAELRRLHAIVMRADDVIKEWERSRTRGSRLTEALLAGLMDLKGSLEAPSTPLQR